MKILKLRNEFRGMIISKMNFEIGNITFDSTNVDPNYFINYQKLGFDLFDEVNVDPDTLEEITEVIVEEAVEEPKAVEAVEEVTKTKVKPTKVKKQVKK